METKTPVYGTKKWVWILLGIGGAILIFSFFAPTLFTQQSDIFPSFDNTGNIGDTIGGVMNPFVTIVGIVVTFAAFYIQYEANKEQRIDFVKEINAQKNQFDRSQFDNQFYQMLDLHKQNVNEIYAVRLFNDKKEKVFGRDAMTFLLSEFEAGFFAINFTSKDHEAPSMVNEAYRIFFHGYRPKSEKYILDDTVRMIRKSAKEDQLQSRILEIDKDFNLSNAMKYPCELFNGHAWQLSHYYRHLFQTVKFVANQQEDFIDYEAKRRYLRVLRAQLSNEEQVLLFYNWLSMFGRKWENEENRFFTDFRMIHNVRQEQLVEGVDLMKMFAARNFRKEKERRSDSLFEFQDWSYQSMIDEVEGVARVMNHPSAIRTKSIDEKGYAFIKYCKDYDEYRKYTTGSPLTPEMYRKAWTTDYALKAVFQAMGRLLMKNRYVKGLQIEVFARNRRYSIRISSTELNKYLKKTFPKEEFLENYALVEHQQYVRHFADKIIYGADKSERLEHFQNLGGKIEKMET